MIRTLIVMTTYGQIYYSKEDFFGGQAGETDISLTAGLISAIYNMTTETQQQKITELELENDRSVFRELPGEKLFIITVDKRMDTDDADDMLDDLASSFADQYGDMVMDGMILNDFEPTVDQVVEDRLWYSTTPSKISPIDIIGFLAVIAAMVFYPVWLLQGQRLIIDPLKTALTAGFIPLILQSLIVAIATLGPFGVLLFLSRYSNINLLFRFGLEYLQRPTRGGYAEQLPSWFLVFPIAIVGTLIASIRAGRGMQYALTLQLLPEFFEGELISGQTGESIFWQAIYIFVILYVITWFIVFPFIIGLITGDLSLRWFKSSIVIIGYSTIVHLPTHILGGVIYHNLVGFNPDVPSIFGPQTTTLEYLFIVTLPVNLFLFVYFYFLATGLNQLVTKNKERFPIALVIAFFIILGLQNIIFFILFRSGLIFGQLF